MLDVLWLASWYPNRLDKFEGDFIQRHARAVAIFCKVFVIYIKKDTNMAAGTVSTELSSTGNLTEKIIYYHPAETGIKIIDRVLSHWKFMKLYKKAVTEFIAVNGKPANVHVHIAMKAGLVALWLKKKWGLPYILTEHWTGYFPDSKPSLDDYNWYYKKLIKTVLKKADLVLPVTFNLGETITKNIINIPFEVIPNVVDIDLFYYKPVVSAKFKFVHISYMNHQKNPEGILFAAKQLKEKGYDFEILLIGNNAHWLLELANSYSLTNETIKFIDVVSYSDVAMHMQAASAFLLFSRFENLPCVILEALCCGLPVISTNVGGISEVVNKENGVLVENENITELADAMQEVMENYPVYNKKNIADNAVEKFNYTTVGAQYLETYNNI